jgi:hypothetical protein
LTRDPDLENTEAVRARELNSSFAVKRVGEQAIVCSWKYQAIVRQKQANLLPGLGVLAGNS